MKKIISFLFIAVFWGAFCYAQQAISTAGGEATGAGGIVSFTVGQTPSVSLMSSLGSVIPGIQQPFEIYDVTNLNSNKEITLVCEVYPNPATDFLNLKVQHNRFENLSYQLIDLDGKILEERPIKEVETSISLQHYLFTTYFLRVTYNTKEIKTFKIIKN